MSIALSLFSFVRNFQLLLTRSSNVLREENSSETETYLSIRSNLIFQIFAHVLRRWSVSISVNHRVTLRFIYNLNTPVRIS